MLEYHLASTLPLCQTKAFTHALLVEDDPDQREFLSMLIASFGINVTAAPNGTEALKEFSAMKSGEAYDFILLDLNLPDIDGYTAAQQLRSDGAHIPIIALTANSSLHARNQSRFSGCDAMLAKRTLKDTLLPTLDQLHPNR